jgi:hypothetical protein
MLTLVWIVLAVAGGVLSLAGLLHLVPALGGPGRSVSQWLCRAPALDVTVFSFTMVPWIAGAWVAGWAGWGAGLVGQLIGLGIWVMAHEWTHQRALAGPRIVTFINRTVGRWRNHAALWVTAIVLPTFWMIRLGEIFVYPLLVWLLNFPRYRQGEWVNCSRQKFEGLIGHDLIWCLYCDWMTGVYSLGAEMLRNVESFWCPIRFYDGKKCENCRLDFPDIDGGWVPASGSMADVERVMTKQYAQGRREWFGHPARQQADGAGSTGGGGGAVLTVEGRAPGVGGAAGAGGASKPASSVTERGNPPEETPPEIDPSAPNA